jgi:adenosylmethionine-8-amino-7-oxononanoate aminotransferase
MLEGLLDIEIVGDVRGAGYFWALELVKDSGSKARFSRAEVEKLTREILGPELFQRGLIARIDSRGDPVIQLVPPLIAGVDHFDEIEAALRPALEFAANRMLH